MSEAPIDAGAATADTPAQTTADPTTTQSPATIADGAQTQSPPPPQTWPDDWRAQIAGADEKERKQLERYASPADVWKKARELEKERSSGKLRVELPPNPTEEQITAYRQANSIPLDGKYDTKIKEGFVWSDDDTPLLEDFSKFAHEANMPEPEFKKALAWYADYERKSADQMAENDHQRMVQAEEVLRREFGPEYRGNINAVQSLFTTMPQDVRDNFLTARMDDGSILGNHPEIVKWAANLARELNPASTVLPAGTTDAPKAIKEELAELKKFMATNRQEYFKDTAKQERMRELLDAQATLESRGR